MYIISKLYIRIKCIPLTSDSLEGDSDLRIDISVIPEISIDIIDDLAGGEAFGDCWTLGSPLLSSLKRAHGFHHAQRESSRFLNSDVRLFAFYRGISPFTALRKMMFLFLAFQI